MDKMINRPNIYKMNEFTMSHIHLTKDDLIGRHDWKGKLDLLNIVMIGLAKELPEHSEMYELHRLLGALLSNRLSLGEKLDIIGGAILHLLCLSNNHFKLPIILSEAFLCRKNILQTSSEF